jgi:hypothetical protein
LTILYFGDIFGVIYFYKTDIFSPYLSEEVMQVEDRLAKFCGNSYTIHTKTENVQYKFVVQLMLAKSTLPAGWQYR